MFPFDDVIMSDVSNISPHFLGRWGWWGKMPFNIFRSHCAEHKNLQLCWVWQYQLSSYHGYIRFLFPYLAAEIAAQSGHQSNLEFCMQELAPRWQYTSLWCVIIITIYLLTHFDLSKHLAAILKINVCCIFGKLWFPYTFLRVLSMGSPHWLNTVA